ncbi:MAG: transposase, partial [Acidimicrobiales bacterium]|nr:transposase [Acidimicrobiales bacterium]
MIFVGVDWAEAHHDVCLLDEGGGILGKRRIGDTVQGLRDLHELIAEHCEEPEEVAVGIEKDRGLVVTSLVASGFTVYAINPMAASRYRDRHTTSGAKSDPGDAKMLADLVRTDRHNHRAVAGDSTLAEAVKILARGHQNAVWSRQRQVNALRNSLKDYYPGALEAFGTDLASRDAVAVLAAAPTPTIGRAMTKANLVNVLKAAGRQRYLDQRAEQIQVALRAEQMSQPAVLEGAYGRITASTIRVIEQLTHEVTDLESALAEHFETHPDAKIILFLPGLGMTLGARVLGEVGDDPNRYSDAKSRRTYGGTSPITQSPGRSRT